MLGDSLLLSSQSCTMGWAVRASRLWVPSTRSVSTNIVSRPVRLSSTLARRHTSSSLSSAAPIHRVRGATTDLAELLVGLEDTIDVDTTAYDQVDARFQASPSGPPVPIHDRAPAAPDVPADLQQLIGVVDERLSVQLDDLAARGFGDEYDSCSTDSTSSSDSDSSEEILYRAELVPCGTGGGLLAPPFEYPSRLANDKADSTGGFDVTKSSFEGHCTTAAAALRSMLSGQTVEAPSPPDSATLRMFQPPASATLRPSRMWELAEEHEGALPAASPERPPVLDRPSVS